MTDTVHFVSLGNENKTTTAALKKSVRSPYRFNPTILGQKWYKHLVPQGARRGGALFDDYKPQDTLSHMIVRYTKKYNATDATNLYAYFDSYIDFFDYQKKIQDCSFYEIINGYQKPHFDIDMKMSDTDKMDHYFYNTQPTIDHLLVMGHTLISTIIKSCITLLEPYVLDLQNDILLFTSHGQKQLSYHIVIDHYCHLDNMEAKAFYQKVERLTSLMLNGKYVEFMDSSVYKTNQAFRLVGSHKVDDKRVKVLQHQWSYNDEIITYNNVSSPMEQFAKSLVCFTSGCQLLQSFKDEQLYNLPPVVDLDDKDLDEIQSMLHKEFKNMFKIRRVKNHKIYLLRQRAYYCTVCSRKHEHENPKLTIFNGCVKWDCQRNEDKRKIILGYLTSSKSLDNDIQVEEENDDTGNFVSFGDQKIDLTKPAPTTQELLEDIIITKKSRPIIIQQPNSKMVDYC